MLATAVMTAGKFPLEEGGARQLRRAKSVTKILQTADIQTIADWNSGRSSHAKIATRLSPAGPLQHSKSAESTIAAKAGYHILGPQYEAVLFFAETRPPANCAADDRTRCVLFSRGMETRITSELSTTTFCRTEVPTGAQE